MLNLYGNHPSLFQQDLTLLMQGLMANGILALTRFWHFQHHVGMVHISGNVWKLGTELTEGINEAYPQLKTFAGLISLTELLRIACSYQRFELSNGTPGILESYASFYHTLNAFAYGVHWAPGHANTTAHLPNHPDDDLALGCKEMPRVPLPLILVGTEGTPLPHEDLEAMQMEHQLADPTAHQSQHTRHGGV